MRKICVFITMLMMLSVFNPAYAVADTVKNDEKTLLSGYKDGVMITSTENAVSVEKVEVLSAENGITNFEKVVGTYFFVDSEGKDSFYEGIQNDGVVPASEIGGSSAHDGSYSVYAESRVYYHTYTKGTGAYVHVDKYLTQYEIKDSTVSVTNSTLTYYMDIFAYQYEQSATVTVGTKTPYTCTPKSSWADPNAGSYVIGGTYTVYCKHGGSSYSFVVDGRVSPLA